MIDPRMALVRDEVAALHPVNDRVEASQRRCLVFLEHAERPFEREAGAEHLTGSAVVMSKAGILLHLHKLAPIWVGPGGHVEGNELPSDAAVRETYEETGVVAWHPPGGPMLVHLDTHDTPNGHVHHDLRYALLSEPDEPVPGAGESPEVAWFPDDAAHVKTDGSYSAALLTASSLQLMRP